MTQADVQGNPPKRTHALGQTPSGPAGSTDTPGSPGRAWAGEELVNPHASPEKAGKVRRMFAAIAGSYDLNNRVHSAWQDQRWRRFAVRSAAVRPGDHVLDVACGTGDLTQAFAHSPAAKVVGLDFTREMLDVAGRKRAHVPRDEADKITYIEGDAQQLPFPDASFDVLSIAFGIRNVASPAAAISEFFRVLKPGGRLVILEFDRPANPVARWFNDLYCARIMPRTATLISGDKSGAYKYLPASVGAFMTRRDMCNLLQRTGFEHISDTALTMGICVCYRSQKPIPGPSRS